MILHGVWCGVVWCGMMSCKMYDDTYRLHQSAQYHSASSHLRVHPMIPISSTK